MHQIWKSIAPFGAPIFLRSAWLFAFAAAIAFAADASTPESLRERTRRSCARDAYGIYLSGLKVGWQILETKLDRHGEQEVVVQRTEMQASWVTGTNKVQWSVRDNKVFSLEGAGELLRAEREERLPVGGTQSFAVERGGAGWLMNARTNGVAFRRLLPSVRKTWQSVLEFDRWIEQPRKAGDQLKQPGIDWSLADCNTTHIYACQAVRQTYRENTLTNVVVLALPVAGETVELEYLGGRAVKMRLIGLEWRLEDEAKARRVGAVVLDLERAKAGATIPAGRNLGPTEKLESLTLELKGLGDHSAVPESHRQRVLLRDGGRTVVEVKRDFRTGESSALTAEERERFLSLTAGAESGSDIIKARAQKIVGRQRDPVKAAAKLQHWVYKNLRGTETENATSAAKVLAQKSGDCTEHCLLFVSLARAAGIPAREAVGLLYVDRPRPQFEWHAWAEIHDGRQWISVDPAWDEVFVDAAHVKLGQSLHEHEDRSWMTLLFEHPKLKILDFRSSSRKK